jgi:CRISPR-associated protein Csd1
MTIILQRLAEYATTRGLNGDFAEKLVHFIVELSPRGKFVRLEPGPKSKTPVPLPNGHTMNIAPEFFWGDFEYVFGLGDDDKTPTRHASFKALVTAVAEKTKDEGALAVASFLSSKSSWPKVILDAHGGANASKGKTQFTFRLEGAKRYVFESPKLRNYWIKSRQTMAMEGETGICRVTGEVATIARLHQSIRNLPGTKGAKLCAWNAPSFEFEGRSQGENFECSTAIADGSGAALNELLRPTVDRRHLSAVDLGRDHLAVLFTTTAKSLDPFLDVLDPPFLKTDQLSETVSSAWVSLSSNFKKDKETCCILVIKAYQTRIMIYDWIEIPLSTLATNLLAWRAEMGGQLLHLRGALFPLATGTKATTQGVAIFRALVQGTPYPVSLLNPKTSSTTWLRAAAQRNKEEQPMSVNLDHPSEAYHRGRLAHFIVQLQYEAYKSNNLMTHVTTAATQPEKGFSILRPKMMTFLTALQQKKKGSFNKHPAMAIIDAKITSMPKTHTAPEKSAFWDGFMAEQAANYLAYKESKAKKENEAAVEAGEEPEDEEDAAE